MLDQPSGSRVELITGKGDDPNRTGLFGLPEECQWAALAENYALLRGLWREEEVSWESATARRSPGPPTWPPATATCCSPPTPSTRR
ncbi:LLM class flavin-dependent oxidoreductase [Streptomyces sp. CBMA123]|uniref:LLM class flavin-dependent oxidoreductase n=1 Tax=Streptomyces sp. CBMA123 TaxID=1896313 RepID=UPI001CB823F1|nr:LLM class flavin-dependent oxidoreductase [Streptomyces sp. CBMA123]